MPRVLIVDDDPDLRSTLADCLAEYGMLATTASDADEALERLRESSVDLVLLDVVMPGMDPQEFVSRCRQLPGLQHVPVIVITGMISASISGTDLRLNKPFELDQLLDAIRRCTGGFEELDSTTGA